jgi:hypothetical protein
MQSMQQQVQQTSGAALTVLIMAVTVAILGALVGVGIYYLLKKTSLKVDTYLLPESKLPLLGTTYKKSSGAAIPRAYNGRRNSLSFWIYLNDVDKFRGIYRHVFHRGDAELASASPLVFMDKDTNRLYVRYDSIKQPTAGLSATTPYEQTIANVQYVDRSSGSVVNKTLAGTFKNSEDGLDVDLAKHGIAIDYIPLQRWVHVAVVVNEDVNGGMISAYVDGELVKHVRSNTPYSRQVAITGKLTTTNSNGAETVDATANDYNATVTFPRSYQGLNLDKVGDIYTGGDPSSSVGPGFSGLVASIRFSNHDMNAADVYKLYEAGPVDNVAAKLGLPAYGVRTPMYRI